MSRSYKRVPCCKDHSRGMKQRANRYLRRNCLMVPSGMAYKKFFCSYYICDYKFLTSFKEYREWYNLGRTEPSSHRDVYREWYKIYKMK